MPALSIAPERSPAPMATLASKHVRQKPSLKRKRLMDVHSPADRGSSPKRSVTFSDEVEFSCQERTRAPEEIQLEVRRALAHHGHGEDDEYNELTAVFAARSDSDEAPSPATLRLYTAALASNISLLDRSCSQVVHAVLGSEWLHQDEQYIELFIRMLGGLVSSYGTWLAPTLKMLAEKFAEVTPQHPTQQYATPQNEAAQHVHDTARYLLQLVPSASQVFSTLISREFPQQLDSRRRHVRYVRNLLKLREYSPELHAEVMSLIIDRLVKIDVQVQADFEDLADEIGDDLLQSLADLEEQIADELMEDESDDEDSDDELDENTQKLKTIKENMGKLDAIMDILFTAYSAAFDNPASAAGAGAASLLTSQFTTVILPTYRSRHTQFLLFHFMQTSPALVDQFLGSCIQLILDKNRPAIIRQSAAAYLASFVSRGMHVPKQVTREVFSFIGDELSNLRRAYEPDCRGPDPRRYHTYYALAQALLYIFCFRWRDLASDDDDTERHSLSPPRLPGASGPADAGGAPPLSFPSRIKEALAANIFSPLNPLRVCAPMIAAEFADTARKLSLLYVHHVLEKNKRVRLVRTQPRVGYGESQRETALSARKDEEWMCLDGYFPFDPYRLPLSKHWVEADYRNWEGFGDEEDEDDDEDEEDESENDEAATAQDAMASDGESDEE